MASRAFNIATGISTAFLVATVVLAVASVWLNPWDHRLSLGDSFHVGIWGRGWDTRLVFFNDAEYGPYCGSIIGFVDKQGNMHPPLERELQFGDTAGVYFRYFRWSGATLWTLMLLVWYPAVAFAILPAWWWLRRRRARA